MAGGFNTEPVNAVYFGEYDGTEQPYAIGVDEWGFIVVAGTTNSARFGVPNPSTSMLYVKTHWDLNYEVTTGGYTSYLKRRFVTPKKFRNYQQTNNGLGNAITYTAVDYGNDGIDAQTATQLIFMIDMLGTCNTGGYNLCIFTGALV